MPELLRSPIIQTPRNLAEILKQWRRHPDSLLLTGGTYLVREGRLEPSSGKLRPIIFLSGIDEFTRIYKTERYLEIGAAVSINQLLDLGPRILPGLLLDSLKGIGSLPVRNMATVGGNLCVRNRRMDLCYPFALMDAKFEVRNILHPAVSHWVNWNQLAAEYLIPDNAPPFLLCRCRLPENSWNLHMYKKMIYTTVPGPDQRLIFCGLARIVRGILEDFRFLFGSDETGFFRDKNLESLISGRALPLPKKECVSVIQSLKKVHGDESFEAETFVAMMEEFLFRVNGFYWNAPVT